MEKNACIATSILDAIKLAEMCPGTQDVRRMVPLQCTACTVDTVICYYDLSKTESVCASCALKKIANIDPEKISLKIKQIAKNN